VGSFFATKVYTNLIFGREIGSCCCIANYLKMLTKKPLLFTRTNLAYKDRLLSVEKVKVSHQIAY